MHVIGLTGGFCTREIFRPEGPGRAGLLHHARRRPGQEHHLQPRIRPCCRRSSPCSAPGSTTRSNGLDKEKFSQALFEDHEKRNVVNAIVHPLVSEERKKKIRAIDATGIYDFLIYESALLLESGIYREFEKIIVVYSSSAVQLRRAMERDKLSRAEAQKRIRSQFPLREKLKVANYTIDSSGSFESTRANTMEVFHLLKKDFNLL